MKISGNTLVKLPVNFRIKGMKEASCTIRCFLFFRYSSHGYSRHHTRKSRSRERPRDSTSAGSSGSTLGSPVNPSSINFSGNIDPERIRERERELEKIHRRSRELMLSPRIMDSRSRWYTYIQQLTIHLILIQKYEFANALFTFKPRNLDISTGLIFFFSVGRLKKRWNATRTAKVNPRFFSCFSQGRQSGPIVFITSSWLHESRPRLEQWASTPPPATTSAPLTLSSRPPCSADRSSAASAKDTFSSQRGREQWTEQC